jgi:hypothetical protein
VRFRARPRPRRSVPTAQNRVGGEAGPGETELQREPDQPLLVAITATIPKVASYLRIEEREAEAGGLN